MRQDASVHTLMRATAATLDRFEALLVWVARLRRRWPSLAKFVIMSAALTAAVALVAFLLGPVSDWAMPAVNLTGKEKVDALNGTRQVIVTAAGGVAVLLSIAYTARTFHLSRQGQLADRY